MTQDISSADLAVVRKLLPYESKYATVGGRFKMHYYDEGSGPVVVLLHGNPTWSFFYRNLIEDLRVDHRVIAPDHVGCGLSERPEDAHFKAVDRVNHLDDLLNQLGINQFSLVMHDWGGAIGTSLAIRRVSQIVRLVYLNTTLTEVESLPGIIKRAHMPVIGKFLTKITKNFLNLMVEFGVAKRLPYDVRQGYLLPYRTISRRTAIWDFVADIPFESTHPSYPEMMTIAEGLPELSNKAETLILWGLRDPCFHKEMLSKVAGHFPKARVVEMPDASHLVLEDKPEIVIPEIRAFLTEQPAPNTCSTEEQDGEINYLYSSFKEHAKSRGFQDAVIIPEVTSRGIRYSHTTYNQLYTLVCQYERGLSQFGLRAGDRVLMLVPPGVEFLALAYAVMGRGATPVFVDPGVGRSRLMRCIADASPDVLIGVPKAHLLRLFKKKLFPRLRLSVFAAETPFLPIVNLNLLKKFSSVELPDAKTTSPSMVAFTSGATGTPKGVVFTNKMLTAQLKIFKDQFEFEPGRRSLPLLPIFSIFDIAMGVSSVVPPLNPSRPLDLDPKVIERVISELGIAYSFGSPTLWKKISDYCLRGRVQLPTIRHILLAGAPVPDAVLSRVQDLLPSGEARTPYGATEALPVTAVRSRDIIDRQVVKARSGEQGTFVGSPVVGVQIKIIESNNKIISNLNEARELEQLEIGEIIVQGDNVSESYISRPDANKIGKIRDGEKVWHRMGDVGYLDSAGNLYFCGRKAHVVSIGSGVKYSVPVERIFNKHPKVRRSALVSIEDGACAGIAIEPEPDSFPSTSESKREFLNELEILGADDPVSADIKRFFFHPSFPVDSRHNAKIFREQLSAWATEIVREEKRQGGSASE